MTEAPEMVKYNGRNGMTISLLADELNLEVLSVAYSYGCYGTHEPDLIMVHPDTYEEIYKVGGSPAGEGVPAPVSDLTFYNAIVTKTEHTLPGIVLFFLPLDVATRLIGITNSMVLRKDGKDQMDKARPTQPIIELIVNKELLNEHILHYHRQ